MKVSRFRRMHQARTGKFSQYQVGENAGSNRASRIDLDEGGELTVLGDPDLSRDGPKQLAGDEGADDIKKVNPAPYVDDGGCRTASSTVQMPGC